MKAALLLAAAIPFCACTAEETKKQAMETADKAPEQPTAKVEKTVAALKSRNIGVLIISHSLDQVFRLSDRICVLRRGKQIGVRETAKTDKNEIVSMITGV